MMKTDYEVEKASSATIEAMHDRCETQGHDWQNCCSAFFKVYMRCQWCGEEK